MRLSSDSLDLELFLARINITPSILHLPNGRFECLVVPAWVSKIYAPLTQPNATETGRCHQGHGKAVDWWSFGVLLFEMMAGYPPFYDEEITCTYKKILSAKYTFPSYFSAAARDLLRKLLQA